MKHESQKTIDNPDKCGNSKREIFQTAKQKQHRKTQQFWSQIKGVFNLAQISLGHFPDHIFLLEKKEKRCEFVK